MAGKLAAQKVAEAFDTIVDFLDSFEDLDPQDNCGTTYFTIEFRGVNAMNFGDYTDGFSPQNAPAPGNAILPGCSVADDFTHALGDPAEGRLAAALNYMAGGSCPLPATGLARSLMAQQASAVDGRLPDSPLRNLRILRR